MKNKKIIIIAIICIVVLICAFFILNPSIKTEMALTSTIEDKSVHRALIIRDEKYVIDIDGKEAVKSDGIIHSNASDGEYVKKAKNVATFYKNDESQASKDMQKKLSKVTERINQIKNSDALTDVFEGDNVKLESDISRYARDFSSYTLKKDGRNISTIKSKIEYAKDKKDLASGEKLRQELNALEKEKQEYEKGLSNLKTELYSPSSGIFFASVDGFEKILTKNSINSITVDDFEKVYSEQKNPDSTCKIIDNYVWYAAIEVDKERAKSFKVGETVFLNFSTINKNFTATVESISKEKGGKQIICTSSTEYDVDISTLRKTDITLIKNMYKGLLIPSEAIREVDGKTGVYAIKGRTATFVETKIIYNDKEHAIVKEYNPFVDTFIPSVKLNLYDEVIITKRGIYHGKLVKWGNFFGFKEKLWNNKTKC